MYSNLQILDFVTCEAARPLAILGSSCLSLNQVASQMAVLRIRVASLFEVVESQLAHAFNQLLLLLLDRVLCDVLRSLLASCDQDLLRRSVCKGYDLICKRTDSDFIWSST